MEKSKEKDNTKRKLLLIVPIVCVVLTVGAFAAYKVKTDGFSLAKIGVGEDADPLMQSEERIIELPGINDEGLIPYDENVNINMQSQSDSSEDMIDNRKDEDDDKDAEEILKDEAAPDTSVKSDDEIKKSDKSSKKSAREDRLLSKTSEEKKKAEEERLKKEKEEAEAKERELRMKAYQAWLKGIELGEIPNPYEPYWVLDPNDYEGGSTKSSSSDSPNPPYVPVDPVRPGFRNQKAAFIAGHDITSLGTGLSVPGTYYADTYATIVENESGSYSEDDPDTDILRKKNYTLMYYMCGSDLESDEALSTFDILKAVTTQDPYSMNNMNVLFMVGGSKKWASSYINGDCRNDGAALYYLDLSSIINDPAKQELIERFREVAAELGSASALCHVDPDDLASLTWADYFINDNTLKKLADIDPIDVGDASLLTGFLDYSEEYFEASNYGLVMWNHGSGINGGVCLPDAVDGLTVSSIEAWELESALASSKLVSENNDKLSLLAFHACLMGSNELAINMDPYCDYMIGSSEIIYDGAPTDKIISAINNRCREYNAAPTTEGIDNRQIAIDYTKIFYDEHRNDYEEIADIICYDQSMMEDYYEAINSASEAILDLYYLNSDYATASSALQKKCMETMMVARSRTFSTGNKGVGLINYDYVNSDEFIKNLKKEFKKWSDELNGVPDKLAEKAAVDEIVKRLSAVSNVNYLVSSAVTLNGATVYNMVEDETGAVLPSTGEDYASIADDDYNVSYLNLTGSKISGGSLYFPYYAFQVHNTPSAGSYYGSEGNAMNIIPNYASLVKLFCDYKENVDSVRVARLTGYLESGDNYKQLFEANIPETRKYAKKYLETDYPEAPEGEKRTYVRIPLTGEYTITYNNGAGTYTGNSYLDFIDTLSMIEAYACTYVNEGTSEDPEDRYYILGEKMLGDNVINPGRQGVDFSDTLLKSIVGTLVTGNYYKDGLGNSTDTAQNSEFEKVSDLELELYSKKTDYISKLLGTADLNEDNWKTYYISLIQKTEDEINSYDAYALFNYDSSTETYKLQGVVGQKEDGELHTYVDLANNEASVYENSAVRFYQYYVDNNEIKKDISSFALDYVVSDSLKVTIDKNVVANGEVGEEIYYTAGFAANPADSSDGLLGEKYVVNIDTFDYSYQVTEDDLNAEGGGASGSFGEAGAACPDSESSDEREPSDTELTQDEELLSDEELLGDEGLSGDEELLNEDTLLAGDELTGESLSDEEVLGDNEGLAGEESLAVEEDAIPAEFENAVIDTAVDFVASSQPDEPADSGITVEIEAVIPEPVAEAAPEE